MSEKIPVVLFTLLFLTFTGLSQSPNSPLSADKTTQIVSDDEYRIYEILYAEWFGKEKLKNFVIDPNLDTCTKVTWFANPENSKIPESKTDEIEANCGRMSLGTLDANRF